MASFSTEFPIDSKNTTEDVLRLACQWITGSPHTKIGAGGLDHIPLDDEQTIYVEAEEVTTATAKLADFEIGGLRYIRREADFEWTTSIVTRKTRNEHLLSIQVACEAISTAVRLPLPKKPYFVRQALTKLGGGMDGEIPVADRPFYLEEGEAEVAAALMLGTAHNRLPIVYISAGFDGSHLIDADEMARFVSGMAHVVVEPSRPFSYAVKPLVNARNVYGGTIGVYWPESTARKSYFLDDETPNARAVQLEIAKDIRLALCNRRLRSYCTWTHVKETVARKRYELLKARGSTEVQEYIEAFDADQAAKDAKLLEAEREIARLNAEVQRLESITTFGFGGVLAAGKEQDLYEREIQDIAVEALEDAIRNVQLGSRRQHVLADLLEANKPSGERARLKEEIKSIFKTYRDMDSRTRNALTRLGFDLSEDGKHWKATFQGDGRYTFSVPKTSGDYRAGKNMASDINKTLF